MACYHPWTHHLGGATRLLSCGQCIGCRLEKSRQWAVRCVHEAQLHKENCSITLTYDEQHLPENNNLEYRDWQLFMKRLRKSVGYPIRFYMAGEYGSQNERPHFHACLFGHDFNDKIKFKDTAQGHVLYTSKTLEKIWGKGFTSIGALTFQTAAYAARYIMKKITGKKQKQHYEITQEKTGKIINKKTEFNNMSRRPGIGQNWLKKYKTDVYPEGTLIINAQKARPPRYYDLEYKKTNPRAYARMIAKRAEEALSKLPDQADHRLTAKQTVKQAQLNQLKRKL